MPLIQPVNNRMTSSTADLKNRPSIGNVSINSGASRSRSNSARNSISVNQERTLYLTFVCLTITFLVCHLPRIVLNVYEVPMSRRRAICNGLFHRPFYQPRWVIILTSIEKMSLIINSSINFFFYCLVGRAFRHQMCKVSRLLKFPEGPLV